MGFETGAVGVVVEWRGGGGEGGGGVLVFFPLLCMGFLVVSGFSSEFCAGRVFGLRVLILGSNPNLSGCGVVV